MGKEKCYIISIKFVSELILVPWHFSEYPKFAQIYIEAYLKSCPFPPHIKSYILSILTYILVPVIATVMSDWTCSRNAIALHFSECIFIPNYFVLLCKVYSFSIYTHSTSGQSLHLSPIDRVRDWLWYFGLVAQEVFIKIYTAVCKSSCVSNKNKPKESCLNSRALIVYHHLFQSPLSTFGSSK